MDEFQEHVPTTATFDVGYFEGKQQSKIWLVTSDDLHKMYELHPKGGEVLLWCDGASDVGSESLVGSKHSRKKQTQRHLSAVGRNARLNLCTRSCEKTSRHGTYLD